MGHQKVAPILQTHLNVLVQGKSTGKRKISDDGKCSKSNLANMAVIS